MTKCWRQSPLLEHLSTQKTNEMKNKAIKNKKPTNQTPLKALIGNPSITQAIREVTGVPHIFQATVQIPAPQEAIEAPETVAYKMRVECYQDCALIHDMLWPYLEAWQEKWETVNIDGKGFKGPGVEVRFELTQGTLSLQNLQSLFHCIADCHVAEETVAIEQTYTGERTVLKENRLVVPQIAMIDKMAEKVGSSRRFLQILLRRTESLQAMLKDVASSGSLPKMSKEGFIMLLEHKASGTVSIRRVSAVKGVDDPVQERHVLLNHASEFA